MKRFHHLTLVLFAMLFGTAAMAQTQKGNLMVGANLSRIGFTFQNESTTFKFNLTPKLAWFIKDDLALGGYVDFGLSTTKNSGSDVNYGIGAFARYFIQDKNVRKLEFSKRARFFLEGNAGFAGRNPASGATTNGVQLGIGPGLAYFITPNVALEGLLKYDVTIGGGNSTTAHDLGINIGFQIYLPTARAKQIIREERGK